MREQWDRGVGAGVDTNRSWIGMGQTELARMVGGQE